MEKQITYYGGMLYRGFMNELETYESTRIDKNEWKEK